MQAVFIYALNCPLTGRTRYIGKSVNPQKRFKHHFSTQDVCRRTKWVQSLLKKGLTPVLEIIASVSEDNWQFWERSYIHLYRALGFDLVNGTVGGDAGPIQTGQKQSSETIAKRIAANAGYWHSPETRAKISAAHLGKKHSPETRAKMSASHLGEKNPIFGKHHSLETRSKISNSLKGKTWPQTPKI